MPSENVIQMAKGKKAFIDLYKPPTTSDKLIIAILKSIYCASSYNMLSVSLFPSSTTLLEKLNSPILELY